MKGRDFVTPDDVKRVAYPLLSHRVVLTPDAKVNNVRKDEIIESVLDSVPVPTVE
ncbi:MAG: ATPase, partial [Haladaptatus sp.]